MRKQDDILILNNIMAKRLFEKGYKLNNFRPDSKNSLATVFYFERTPKLEKYLKDEFNLNL